MWRREIEKVSHMKANWCGNVGRSAGDGAASRQILTRGRGRKREVTPPAAREIEAVKAALLAIHIKPSRNIMLWCMRTTLTLDDDVAKALERLRKVRGDSFKSLINQALR